MSTNYIDSILAKLNNKVSCIWISGLIFIDKFPDKERAIQSYKKLIQEYPRLNSYYDSATKEMKDIPEQPLDEIFHMAEVPLEEWVDQYIGHKIELNKNIPLRLGFVQFQDGQKLFYIQLHHAIGDGRTFTFLIQRYLELLGEDYSKMKLTTPNVGKKIILKSLVKNPHSLVWFLNPRYRISSARGVKLKSKDTCSLEKPSLQYRIYQMDQKVNGLKCSRIYYGAMAYAMAQTVEKDGLLRLRLPIDIRSELKLPRAFGNLCPCLSLEIESKKIKEVGIGEISDLVYNELRQQYIMKTHHTFHIDSIIYDRFFNYFSGKPHDFFDSKRSNTMVLTYMGDMNNILKHAPFNISNIAAHTPTWGGIGLKLNDKMVFNLNCFKGIWDNDHYLQFFSHINKYMKHYNFSVAH